MAGSVFVIGTMDTKGVEVQFVAEVLRSRGVQALTVDVGTKSESVDRADIPRSRITELSGESMSLLERGQAVDQMGQALIPFLVQAWERGELSGVIGLGGSGGTALITPAMRALPIGIPKVMVSTVASGNVAPYVGCSDILMFPSIVDVAGLNAVSTRILSNAANAMVGMVSGSIPSRPTHPALGLTMFGVTTPCVNAVRSKLESSGFDCLVFHATGVGGQAMEGLVQSRFLEGLLDLTTTEVADEVVGGVFPAGPHRFDVLATRTIPCVLSVGAMDMVNFGAMHTVPEQFRSRRLHVHNSNVTLMRTTPEENRKCAQWMARKLRNAVGPLVVLLPELGVSALDAPGQPFYDPEADAALFEEIEKMLQGKSNVRVERLASHINDPAFSDRAVAAFQEIYHR
jgi:uncharacterized protein (UPF0261 family)